MCIAFLAVARCVCAHARVGALAERRVARIAPPQALSKALACVDQRRKRAAVPRIAASARRARSPLGAPLWVGVRRRGEEGEATATPGNRSLERGLDRPRIGTELWGREALQASRPSGSTPGGRHLPPRRLSAVPFRVRLPPLSLAPQGRSAHRDVDARLHRQLAEPQPFRRIGRRLRGERWR